MTHRRPSARRATSKTVDGVKWLRMPEGWITEQPFGGRRYQAIKNTDDYYSCGDRWLVVPSGGGVKPRYYRSLEAATADLKVGFATVPRG